MKQHDFAVNGVKKTQPAQVHRRYVNLLGLRNGLINKYGMPNHYILPNLDEEHGLVKRVRQEKLLQNREHRPNTPNIPYFELLREIQRDTQFNVKAQKDKLLLYVYFLAYVSIYKCMVMSGLREGL